MLYEALNHAIVNHINIINKIQKELCTAEKPKYDLHFYCWIWSF